MRWRPEDWEFMVILGYIETLSQKTKEKRKLGIIKWRLSICFWIGGEISQENMAFFFIPPLWRTVGFCGLLWSCNTLRLLQNSVYFLPRLQVNAWVSSTELRHGPGSNRILGPHLHLEPHPWRQPWLEFTVSLLKPWVFPLTHGLLSPVQKTIVRYRWS
jgi:hypothetical protein